MLSSNMEIRRLLSEVLGDDSSTITLIFKDGEIKTALGRNKCVKADPTSATAAQPHQILKLRQLPRQKPLKQEEKSFWCKADELLKLGIDEISEEDMVTGVRSLNVMDESSLRSWPELLNNAVKDARANNVRVFQPGNTGISVLRQFLIAL